MLLKPKPSNSGNSPTKPVFFGPWIKATPALCLAAIVVYAAGGGFAAGSNFGSVLATGAIVAAAALIVGTFLGFLFGLPRTLEKSGSPATLATNTNLDQISDWLTKILVGLGLVQLGKVAGGINGLAETVAPGLGETKSAHTFAVGLLVYSAVDGFLLGYLWTRIVVSGRLKAAADELTRPADEVLNVPPPAAPPPLPPPPA
jgi:hypothetical protein